MKKIKNLKRKLLFNNPAKKIIAGFFLIHFLASQFFLPYVGRSEIFPIFNWSLFSSCDEIDESMPEVEIFFQEGGVITSKQFSSKLMSKLFYYMKKIFQTQDQEKADKLLNELLGLISHSINKASFKYRLFKSRIHRIDYIKSDSLKKDVLFKEGLFKRRLQENIEL